jgi:transposase
MLTLMSPERLVPKEHPIRRIKALADAQLVQLSGVFDQMYAQRGRPSIPPETLLKAQLLIALYSVRSERQFCEQLQYNLLFRYVLDLGLDEGTFDASVLAKNKARLLAADVARHFFEGVVAQARAAQLLSAEHFTVDGTLIEAWASLKSVRPKDEVSSDRPPPDDPGNPTVNWHGEPRRNATHASTTDPEAKLARKGNAQAAKLSYSAHVLMENRHGLCVDVSVAAATGEAEWEEGLRLVARQQAAGTRIRTLGADKAYDVQRFVGPLRAAGVTPHVAQQITAHRGSRVDGRTTRHAGDVRSQRVRKRIEEIFGWWKTVGGLRKTRYRGTARVGLHAYWVAAAHNLLRLAKLLAAPA